MASVATTGSRPRSERVALSYLYISTPAGVAPENPLFARFLVVICVALSAISESGEQRCCQVDRGHVSLEGRTNGGNPDRSLLSKKVPHPTRERGAGQRTNLAFPNAREDDERGGGA